MVKIVGGFMFLEKQGDYVSEELKNMIYYKMDNDIDEDELGKYFVNGELHFNVDIISPIRFFSSDILLLSFYGFADTEEHSCVEIHDKLKELIENQLSTIDGLSIMHSNVFATNTVHGAIEVFKKLKDQ